MIYENHYRIISFGDFNPLEKLGSSCQTTYYTLQYQSQNHQVPFQTCYWGLPHQLGDEEAKLCNVHGSTNGANYERGRHAWYIIEKRIPEYGRVWIKAVHSLITEDNEEVAHVVDSWLTPRQGLDPDQHHGTNSILRHKIKDIKVECIHDTQFLHRL